MAARGARNLDDGEKRIDSPWARAALTAQARRLQRRAVKTALLLTALGLLLP